MSALLEQSRRSTPTAALVGIALGVAILALYVVAGLLVANWSVSEFVSFLSLEVVGWLILATAGTVSVFAIPVACYLRFDLYTPLAVLVIVVVGWLTIGVASGLLTVQSVFGLGLYAVLLSPLYFVLYGVLGVGEHYLRRTGRT